MWSRMEKSRKWVQRSKHYIFSQKALKTFKIRPQTIPGLGNSLGNICPSNWIEDRVLSINDSYSCNLVPVSFLKRDTEEFELLNKTDIY